jgi:hypothetical protein
MYFIVYIHYKYTSWYHTTAEYEHTPQLQVPTRRQVDAQDQHYPKHC